jgi:hypothetical protein
MNSDHLRQRANVVREVALETVLMLHGAVRDRCDRRKWHTEQGPLSVSGTQFMNWRLGRGGGGAIDLVMHLGVMDFRTAVAWLEQRLGFGPPLVANSANMSRRQMTATSKSCDLLRLPARDDRQLGRVHQYLTQRRHLAAALLESLRESGRLYADSRGNAVFVMVAGKARRPVGAELRGTGTPVWRGMAPGTRKDAGYFWIGLHGSKDIVLCESAIDAISCFQIHPLRICISTSGVRTNPAWLSGLIARGYHLHCGFDTDQPGEAAADDLIALHPGVQRLRPPAHDWNDALAPRQ